MPEKRSRLFGVVTYISDTDEVLEKVGNKRTCIRSYACIKHDKDEADIHHHLIIRTHSAHTCVAVAKWFADNREEQNTFAEFIHDISGAVAYLTHSTDASKEKYQYSECDIIDGGLSDILPREDAADDSYNIICELLEGVPVREMCKRYGREFIYRYSNYMAIAERIKEDEKVL